MLGTSEPEMNKLCVKNGLSIISTIENVAESSLNGHSFNGIKYLTSSSIAVKGIFHQRHDKRPFNLPGCYYKDSMLVTYI